jgi:hypothetical protein
MVDILKHVGTEDWDWERLNMCILNTPASWSVHALRTQPGMPSGPGRGWHYLVMHVSSKRRHLWHCVV